MAGCVLVRYVKVKAITKQQNEDVYNLEADKYHNFAVNNGIIVHNCMDALRYSLTDIKPAGIQIHPNNLMALHRPRR